MTLAFMDGLREKRIKREREAHSVVATLVWLGTGVYLFNRTAEASLLTLTALIFFAGGILACILILASMMYLLQQTFDRLLMKLAIIPGPKTTSIIRLFGIAMLILNALITYRLAREAFSEYVIGV